MAASKSSQLKATGLEAQRQTAVLLKTARQLQRATETQSLAGSAGTALISALIPALVLSAMVIELAELGGRPARD